MTGIVLAAVLAAAFRAASCRAADPLESFFDCRARLVWLQQRDGGDDPFAWSNRMNIQVLDTADGRGERVLYRPLYQVHRPLLTPRGDRVVFSSFATRRCYVMRWEDAGPRELSEGYALDTWEDPGTGTEWVYTVTTGASDWERHAGRPVIRFPIDDPRRQEIVWSLTPVTIDNFMVSGDGRFASAQFPHPQAGFAHLPDEEWRAVARGCWTSISPDTSYMMWVFDGPHRNLLVYSVADDRQWTVNINGAPGIDGYEVYHPRWSNHPRFLVMTGPYRSGPMGRNLIAAGGREVEVYAGRFATDFTAIEAWRQITTNLVGDFYPDLWVEGLADKPERIEDAHASDPNAGRPAEFSAKGSTTRAPTSPPRPGRGMAAAQ